MEVKNRIDKKVTKTAKSNGGLIKTNGKLVAAVDKKRVVNDRKKGVNADKNKNSQNTGANEKRIDNIQKFKSPDDLTIVIDNDTRSLSKNKEFKAANYKEHKAYKELKAHIDKNIDDNKKTIEKLTDALVEIAARPIVVNINQTKNQSRRSKNNNRKRPNKHLRKLLHEQQRLIKDNPLNINK